MLVKALWERIALRINVVFRTTLGSSIDCLVRLTILRRLETPVVEAAWS